MTYEYAVVNAFTRSSLAGNPVAVFPDAIALSSEQMQGLAAQFQLSETTFVETRNDHHAVRIFTPVNELPFAGHPLIGTAASIHDRTQEHKFQMDTNKYTVRAEVLPDGPSTRWVSLRFPAPKLEFESDFGGLLLALGLPRTVLPISVYDAGARHALVAIEDPDLLSSLQPDLRALGTLDNIAINCFAFDGPRVQNRMFSPAYGVAEDAATGSAVCAIAALLHKHGRLSLDEQIEVTQGSQIGRSSAMYGRLSVGVDGEPQATLAGHTRLFAEGRITGLE